MVRMPDVKLAWLAGFLDGDGCITSNTRDYRIRVIFGQKDPEVLYHIQELMGGAIQSKANVHPKAYAHGIQHHLAYGGKASYELLKLLLPYLVVKQPQAKIAIKMYETHDYPSLQHLHQELRDLKRRNAA